MGHEGLTESGESGGGLVPPNLQIPLTSYTKVLGILLGQGVGRLRTGASLSPASPLLVGRTGIK